MAQPTLTQILDTSHAWASGLVYAGTVPSDGDTWLDYAGGAVAPRGTSDANYSVVDASGTKRARVTTTGAGIQTIHRSAFRLTNKSILLFVKINITTADVLQDLVRWWDTKPFGDGWNFGPNGFGNLFLRANIGAGREIDSGSGTWNDSTGVKTFGIWLNSSTGEGHIYVDGVAVGSLSTGITFPSTEVDSTLVFPFPGDYEAVFLSTTTRTEAEADADFAALHSDPWTLWDTGDVLPTQATGLALTGQDASLTYTLSNYQATWGIYDFRGRAQINAFRLTIVDQAVSASLILTPFVATKNITSPMTARALTLTGKDAGLHFGKVMTADVATLSFTRGTSTAGFSMPTTRGTLSLAGKADVGTSKLVTELSSLALTGIVASFVLREGDIIRGLPGQLTLRALSANLTATGVSRWKPKTRAGDVWTKRNRI